MEEHRTKIYFDGVTGPTNPGHGGAGWAIEVPNKESISSYYYLGDGRTNNESEYAALYCSLKQGIKLGIEQNKVEIYGDSQLVIKQVSGEWRNKKPHLKKLMAKVHELLDLYTDYTLYWIPREQNEVADSMSNRALTENGVKTFNSKDQYALYKSGK